MATISNTSSTPPRIYMFSQPRTRSNLWMKLFENHPDLCGLRYMFQEAWMYGPERQRTRATVPHLEHRLKVHEMETYQYAYDNMMEKILDAEDQGKTAFIKDHVSAVMTPAAIARSLARAAEKRKKAALASGRTTTAALENVFENQSDWRRTWKAPSIVARSPSPQQTSIITYEGQEIESSSIANPIDKKSAQTITVEISPDPSPLMLPDEFLRTIAPVILIRHPIRLLASYYNVAPEAIGASVDDTDFPLVASFALSRTLYDYFSAMAATHGGRKPIVIDGDDIVRDPQGLAGRFCDATGLDPSGVQYSWKATPEEITADENSGHRLFLAVLMGSTSVQRCEDAEVEPDIDEEERKWASKHGAEVARKLREFAEASMEDYLFMKSHKV